MQGGRDPFSGFGDPFGSFGGFGGFGGQRSPFMNPHTSGFLEHQPPQHNLSRGPVIEELNSDDEIDEKESGKENKENPRKHGRSSREPFVVDPDEEATEKKSKHIARRNEVNQMQHLRLQPQTHSFTFQSSTVSYGGANGAYYTSSQTKRAGSDGLTFEEWKEANSSTGQATHKVSRGIHDKGHSVTRKLKSDGHVDTMQTLHNLNEGNLMLSMRCLWQFGSLVTNIDIYFCLDELTGFEEAWKGNVRKHLPGLSGGGFASQDVMGSGSASQQRPNRGGWALPSTERSNNQGSSGAPRHSGRTKPDLSDGTGSARFRSNGAGSSNQPNRR
ncbi:hypothetical protein DH2020_005358 [Rehmannia glutinosa]|uniref:Uncharacterized protein n=1 Tax=Rehmannia glutinosa TaxID=99300 RepID=A0ABR0XFQ3_REHGL